MNNLLFVYWEDEFNFSFSPGFSLGSELRLNLPNRFKRFPNLRAQTAIFLYL